MASVEHGRIDDPDSKGDVSKYFTGTHEVQECLEGQGEADLEFYKKNCKKSHVGYVAADQFTADHFPPGYHDNDLYDLTKALADLTVRIAVKFTSPDRPEFVQGTKDPYPCYNTRGQNSLRTGTGRVWSVSKYTEGMWDYRTCPCPECDHSDTPSKVWWKVVVLTARQVVFDDSEARQSSCRLWFDYDQSPAVNIYGRKVCGSNNEGDWCRVECVTHDVEVGDKLGEMRERFGGLCDKIEYKYKSRRDVDKLTIIVSHPHGCSKQVSVGNWVHREVNKQILKDIWTRYTYTNCTCPGSSGAGVYRLGWGQVHPHWGVASNKLSYSGLYVEYKF
ncbi:uncharacterized protein LOC131941426 [Physella acuta]|uniref:uncharacterized protein LOC131941426 n=1 Tax=Physella acuta TaxID=109671 RepID=UPI0027DDEB66|nr:uncharacterized protein LOC131941426 [Physella acuta]